MEFVRKTGEENKGVVESWEILQLGEEGRDVAEGFTLR